MVFHSFLDDSKDANQSKLFISAGFFGLQEDWGSLRISWKKILDDNGIKYFKSSEYNHLTGEFKKFRSDAFPKPTGREAAKKIKDALQAVVDRHQRIRGVGITIPVGEYEKVRSRPEAAELLSDNIYHHALESVMFETVKLIRKIGGRNVVAFVHDEESDFETLHQVYLGFKKLNPKTSNLMRGFAPFSDKEHPPLQMADMIANNALELGIENLEKGVFDQTRIAMKKNIQILGVWDEHYMLSILKQNLLRTGKPLPVDLETEEYG
jgi:hypothetical protein